MPLSKFGEMKSAHTLCQELGYHLWGKKKTTGEKRKMAVNAYIHCEAPQGDLKSPWVSDG